MKQKGNSFPSKANSICKALNNSEQEEISTIKLKKVIARMIKELKEETYMLVNVLKRI
jgi:hypothetical protein